jgi:hypothetical protein
VETTKKRFADFAEFSVWAKTRARAPDENIPREVRLNDPIEFERVFIESMEANYWIEDSDTEVEVGFVVINSDGVARYCMSSRKYFAFITNTSSGSRE